MCMCLDETVTAYSLIVSFKILPSIFCFCGVTSGTFYAFSRHCLEVLENIRLL